MFGRKPKVLFNRGPAPEWVFCPACYSGDVSEVRRDSWNTTYECSRCTCVFEVSKFTEPGDYQDEYGDGYGHEYIQWRDCSSPMSVVREIAIKEYPVIERFARDQRIFGWICDYWSDVQWNEHGNECGYSELAEYGGFKDIVNQIVYDPESLVAYIRGDMSDEELTIDQVRLIADLRTITSRLNR